jgi:hypothetical protein
VLIADETQMIKKGVDHRGGPRPRPSRRRLAAGVLGLLLRGLGDPSDARDELERALQISEVAFGPAHAHVGIRRANLGLVLRDQGTCPVLAPSSSGLCR